MKGLLRRTRRAGRSLVRLIDLIALEVDAKVEWHLAHVVFGKDHLLLAVGLDLDAQRQAFELLDQHPERFRNACLERVLALDDRLVGLDAAHDVVGLDRQDLLQDVRGTVGFQRPDFHFAKPLAAELRLAAQRLLGDQQVRTRRARVDLVLDQVGQLQHIDVADRHFVVELLTGAAVAQRDLARLRQARPHQFRLDRLFRRAVEDGRRDFQAQRVRRPAQVRLEYLAQVHAARHTERVQHQLDRRAIRHVGHVLSGKDPRDDALVPVPAGHLVALRDLALLGNIDPHQLVDAGRQLVLGFAAEDLDIDHDAALAVRYAQRGIAHLARLLTEDGPQQALLGRELRLALRRDLAHQDGAGWALRADIDDAALVEVLQRLIADIGDIAGDLLRAQLDVAGFDFVLLDVDRGVFVLAHDRLGDQDRVFVVVALPGHERHQDVAAGRQLTFRGGRTVRQRRAGGDRPPGLDDDPPAAAR